MSSTGFRQRYWSLFWGFAGALPWLGLFLLYMVGTVLVAQVGPLRAAGTLALFSGAIALAAAGLALVASFVPPAPRLARGAGLALVAAAWLNLAAVGLAIFFHSPALAPWPWKLAAIGAVAVLVTASLRYPASTRALVVRAFVGLGLGLAALPVLTTPWVIAAAMADRPRLAGAPRPLASPAVRPEAPRRIVLVTFDAWRARSTALATPGHPTPALAKLAAESTWFPRAIAASDGTLTSMPAILTGVGPARIFPHTDNRTGFLRQGLLTGLAGHLAPAGYEAYHATMLVEPGVFGLRGEFKGGSHAAYLFPQTNAFNGQAFLPWRESLGLIADKLTRARGPVSSPGGPGAARATFDQALRLLQAAPDRTFLWVHLGAPHTPYYRVAERGGELVLDHDAPLDFEAAGQGDEAAMRRHEAMYEAYTAYADQELGRFLAGLRRDGLWEETMLVLTADHGEEFVPGRRPHGNGLLTEDVARVPLLVHMPGQREGRRVEALAGHLDVAPTILDAVYHEPPGGFSGSSLLGTLPADRPVAAWGLASHYFTTLPGTPSVALYHDRFKYLRSWPGGREALFDLEADPGAARDLAASRPALVRKLRARLVEEIGPID